MDIPLKPIAILLLLTLVGSAWARQVPPTAETGDPSDGLEDLPADIRAMLPPREDPEGPPESAPKGANPFLNRHYRNADFERWSGVFEQPGREVFDRRFQIVYAAQVQEGMRIADIGAGTGFFAVLFARAVGPEGVVYAVDTAPEFIAGIRERARTYRVNNLVPVVNTQQSTELEPDSIDLAFLSNTYHHLEDPAAMLDSIHQALAPYGGLIIVDFRRSPGLSSSWVMAHVRADRDQVVEEVEAAGFRLVDEPDFLRENYFLRFEKVEAEPSIEVGPIEIDSQP